MPPLVQSNRVIAILSYRKIHHVIYQNPAVGYPERLVLIYY